MESGWLETNSSIKCLSGMEMAWSDLASSMAPMYTVNNEVGSTHGGGGSGGSGGGWNNIASGDWNPNEGGGGVNRGAGSAGAGSESGGEWSVFSPGWPDPVDFSTGKPEDEWEVPENWGIEPPPPYPFNLLMVDGGLEALFSGGGGAGMMFGDFASCAGGFMCINSADRANGGIVGANASGDPNVGDNGGANGPETDPIDFDVDGLIPTSGQDAVGVGGDSTSGLFVESGGSAGSCCPGLTCCQQQGGQFPFF